MLIKILYKEKEEPTAKQAKVLPLRAGVLTPPNNYYDKTIYENMQVL